MRLTKQVILVLLTALPGTARAQDADPWLGPDKALHFGVSAAIASGSYALSAAQLERKELRLVVGFGTALLAGGVKELWDLGGHGQPSWKDFTWDVLGAAVGALISYAVDRLFFSPAQDSPSSARTWAIAASRSASVGAKY